jgi:hypothetical protein
MIISPTYRTNYKYTIETGAGTDTLELLGEYKKGSELEVLSSDFKDQMLSKINTENISTIFGFDKIMSDRLLAKSEDILSPWVVKTITDLLNSIPKSSIVSILSTRNEMIKELDKLNFIVKTSHDGTVTGNVFSGVTLDGFTYDILYNEYSNLVSFIKDYHKYFTEDLDTSFTFSKGSTILIDDFSYFLSELLKDRKTEIIQLYYKDPDFTDRIKKDMGKKLDKFMVVTPVKDKDFSKLQKSYPIRKYSKPLTFNVTDYNYSFSDAEKTMLTNVFKANNNKTTDTLNYFR